MPEGVKQRKQDLGIFYTDQRIANFIFDILKIWKEREEEKIGRWELKKHYPSVIDPAVGEGVFLKVAIQSNFTKPDYIFGLDIDEKVVEKWEDINLLKEFGGKKDDLEAHFFYQNGLDKIHWEQHIDKYRYKLKQKDINAQQFDAVVGNPPYGGVGLGETELTDDLVMQLASFEILPENVKNNLIIANTQSDLFNYGKQLAIRPDAKQRIKSFSIEILFLERFIQLAKPGGWIAIIIPDGILTNSNSHYVREFISQKTKVEAIVSLPRDAFKNVGTTAKTSVLFLQKYRVEEKKQESYPVFLASVESLDEKNFNLIKDNYKNYYNKTMSNKNLVQTTTDEKGREIVMVRVDKTLKEMMEEKPASRWSPGYWHPAYDYLNELLLKTKAKSILEIEGEEAVIAGDHVRPSRGEKKGFNLNTGVEYYETAGFLYSGYDYSNIKECSNNAYVRLKETAVKKYDILISVAGVGGVGKAKSCLVINEPAKKSCTGDVFSIRLKKINPIYFYILMKSKIGKDQILKMKNGVSTENLNTKEALAIRVPEIRKEIQNNVISEFKKVVVYHDKAMEAKKNNDEAEYKKNIETAEEMLKDLIAKTEAVIRGERKDVI